MGTSNIYMTVSDDLGSFGSGVYPKPPSAKPAGTTDAEWAAEQARVGAAPKYPVVEILSFDCEIKQIGAQMGGKPRSVEAVLPGEFNIVKAVDGTSPLFFRWCCVGEYIKKVTVSCHATVRETPYMEYTMHGVHILSWKPSSGGGLPTEAIALKYGRLNVKYNQSGLGGASHGVTSPPGAVEKAWSWVVDMPV